ncbi:hypothetical protein J3F83DRAFT_746799 [Trichoderma novae-zelandiae]
MASTMETINQIATSAAKAVWGDANAETHKEPISGATGDVSKGEPYDAGNLDPQDQSKVESSLNDKGDTPSDLAEGEYYALSSSAKYKPLPETPDTQEHPRDITKPQDTSKPRDIPTGTLADKSTDTATDTSTGEPADKPADKLTDKPTEPSANPEEGKPLDELTGKGPRPVEELARENGGNAAAASSDNSASAPQDKDNNGNKPQPSVEEKQKHENDHAGDAAAEATEYVKTTGFAAEGGDFDAAKPGAGLEADRLMEQKGIKTDDDSKGSGGRKSSDSGHHHKDKPSLGERIKNKLHRH